MASISNLAGSQSGKGESGVTAAVVGALAPWIAVLVLGPRPEGRQAFATIARPLVLLVGYGVTVVAYLLVSRIAAPAPEVRVLA